MCEEDVEKTAVSLAHEPYARVVSRGSEETQSVGGQFVWWKG